MVANRQMAQNHGARDRDRTGTPAIHEAADFKSSAILNEINTINKKLFRKCVVSTVWKPNAGAGLFLFAEHFSGAMVHDGRQAAIHPRERP